MNRRIQSVWRGVPAERSGALAVLVGQAPTRSGRPDRALTGRAGRAIAERCGLTFPGEYVRVFDRVNVYEEFPGSAPSGGDLFPAAPARHRAIALAPELTRRVAVLLGRGVARAFGLPTSAPWYSRWHVALRTTTCPSVPEYRAIDWVVHEHDSHYEHSPCWPSIEEADWRALDHTLASGCHPTPGSMLVRRWHEYPFEAILAPHPSRVSRHWNDSRAREEAERFWSQLVPMLRAQAASRSWT